MLHVGSEMYNGATADYRSSTASELTYISTTDISSHGDESDHTPFSSPIRHPPRSAFPTPRRSTFPTPPRPLPPTTSAVELPSSASSQVALSGVVGSMTVIDSPAGLTTVLTATRAPSGSGSEEGEEASLGPLPPLPTAPLRSHLRMHLSLHDPKMATSGDKCSVCLQAFKDPRVLPCCHTFCRDCLERILEKAASNKKLTCPQCRGEHSVPLEGMEGFLSDFTVGVEASGSSTSISARCGECDSSDPCIAYCCDCQSHLCEYCDTTHKRVKRWQGHTVLPLESVTPDTIKTGSLNCWRHPSEQLKIFCKTCQTVVCCNCIVESHSDGHSYAAVNKATRDEVEEKLKTKLKQARKNLTKLQADLSYLGKVERQVGAQPGELKLAVNEAFDKIIAALETRRAQLLKEVDTTCTGDLKSVWAQKEQMERALVGLETAVGFSQRTLQCTQDTKFLILSSQASTRLDQLEGITWEIDKIKAIERVCRVFQSDMTLVGSRQMVDPGTFGTFKQTAGLSLQNFPQTLELAVETQFTIQGISAKNAVVKGFHGRSKKTFTLKPRKVADGKWVVAFIPVCAGPHSLSILIDGKETEGSPFRFTVQGVPAIGTRVVRGPDWNFGNEDGMSGNCGTVDSQLNGSCKIYVKWDNGNRYDYKWGAGDRYDVMVVS